MKFLFYRVENEKGVDVGEAEHESDKSDLVGKTAQTILSDSKSNELFVAIVGPAGAGAGTAANILKDAFEANSFQAEVIKASNLIRAVSESAGLDVPVPVDPDHPKSVENIRIMQDRGDDLRKGSPFSLPEDFSAVSRLVLNEIARRRATLQGEEFDSEKAINPNGEKRVFIIDSLRHPSEVFLLRRVYHDAFTLLGVVCDPNVREKRIRENLFDRSVRGNPDTKEKVREFLKRDENAPEKYGQHVSDTFYLADYFVDNTVEGSEDLSVTGMNDQLLRFVSLVTHQNIERPSIAETAMHHARSAQMRSACLSRQVGAALVDSRGNIVATGTNEVPKAGGGVYGESFESEVEIDDRCAFKDTVFCSSNKEQNEIIDDLIERFPELLEGRGKEEATQLIRGTRIGGLIEFSRAVHAEMDAILSASRAGVSPVGCRLFVTTYPCHYCARHIVSAGVDEVQFIEPYPKSRATALHSDSICLSFEGWSPPSKQSELPLSEADQGRARAQVLFRPFVGVAPRLYRRVFFKDRDYKDKITGDLKMGEPTWGGSLDTYKVAYTSLEMELGKGMQNG